MPAAYPKHTHRILVAVAVAVPIAVPDLLSHVSQEHGIHEHKHERGHSGQFAHSCSCLLRCCKSARMVLLLAYAQSSQLQPAYAGTVHGPHHPHLPTQNEQHTYLDDVSTQITLGSRRVCLGTGSCWCVNGPGKCPNQPNYQRPNQQKSPLSCRGTHGLSYNCHNSVTAARDRRICSFVFFGLSPHTNALIQRSSCVS